MPLPLRRVEPVHVSRGTLPERFRIQNDLEAVSNGTLANVIVQLSSLSHHAEELFGDLIRVESEIATRANNLQARIDRLAVKVVQMDNNQEELGSMQEALNTKPFQSSMAFDQQVVSRHSMPAAMLKTYKVCDQPPPLDKLNGYRDDGKDGLKFYTDPSYFFDLWRQEMLKDTDKQVKKPHKPKQDGGQKHKKRVRQPQNTRDRLRHIVIEQGEHIMQGQEFNRPAQEVTEVADGLMYQSDPNAAMNARHAQQNMARPSTIDVEKGYTQPGYDSQYGNGPDVHSRGDYRSNHLPVQHHNGTMLNRNISQSQYEYEAYNNNQLHNHSQNRYYAHATPPPAYSDVSSPSPNAYSISSRFSAGGIAASSTPRNGMMSVNVTPNSSMTNGYAFRPNQPPPAPPLNYVGTPPSSQSGNATPTRGSRVNNTRDALPPPPPPPTELEPSHMNGMHNGVVMPPPPPMHDEEIDDPLPPPPPPPDPAHSVGNSIENLAPSPDLAAPPPPPPLPIGNMLSMNGGDKAGFFSNGGIPKKPLEKKIIPAPVDGRSELLKAIRDGIELRKVETKKEPSKEDKAGGTYCDVASILARRVAVEMSDSESGSGSDSDSDHWDEASA